MESLTAIAAPTGPAMTAVLSAFPPIWAGGWGEDHGRRFAQLVVGGVVIEMVWIDADTFQMGSPDNEGGRYTDETPHEVRLTRGYWIGRYPVTQAQWQAVMGNNPSASKGPDLPVEQVSWEDVVGFCDRIDAMLKEAQVLEEGFGFRLPTEAEWECACRAGKDSAFNDGSSCTNPSGKDPALEKLGWYDANSGMTTHPVGQKRPNAWVLYDFHGNVWEWCADFAEFSDGVISDAYPSETLDPIGKQGARRVVRGGGAQSVATICRSTYRSASEPGYRINDLGFRLAAGLKVNRGAECSAGEPAA